MNPFEKVLLGLLAGAIADAPLFVGTPQGILILNASEALLAGILAQFAPKPAAPVAPPAAV
jgi:hypothetical protein